MQPDRVNCEHSAFYELSVPLPRSLNSSRSLLPLISQAPPPSLTGPSPCSHTITLEIPFVSTFVFLSAPFPKNTYMESEYVSENSAAVLRNLIYIQYTWHMCLWCLQVIQQTHRSESSVCFCLFSSWQIFWSISSSQDVWSGGVWTHTSVCLHERWGETDCFGIKVNIKSKSLHLKD